MKSARTIVMMIGITCLQSTQALELIVDAQSQGDFTLVSDALKYINDNRLTTPPPIQTPASGSKATITTTSNVVILGENIGSFSSFDDYSDGLLIKFSGDKHWYSAKYSSPTALTLSGNAHKTLSNVAWEFAIKTPYVVLIKNGVYADTGSKPVAPFVTVRGESQRGVVVQTDPGPSASFVFKELCKEGTLENFSIIPQGPGAAGTIGRETNSDNSPYVNWTLRNMYIDVSRTTNPDTIKFFDEKINQITIENSHIEGSFHILNLWGTTKAVIRNNIIIGHVSSNTQSVVGLYMMPSQGIDVQIENNEFVIIGNRGNSTSIPTFDGSYAMQFQTQNAAPVINGSITGNTIRVVSFNDEPTAMAAGIFVSRQFESYPPFTWNALIDQNTIEIDAREAEQCHISSDTSLNGGTILPGDEQPVIRCGLAY